MKAQWKYIVYLDDAGEKTAEIFGTSIVHAVYAARAGVRPDRLISAGYATADKECFGMSTSLKLNSRPRADTDLLRNS